MYIVKCIGRGSCEHKHIILYQLIRQISYKLYISIASLNWLNFGNIIRKSAVLTYKPLNVNSMLSARTIIFRPKIVLGTLLKLPLTDKDYNHKYQLHAWYQCVQVDTSSLVLILSSLTLKRCPFTCKSQVIRWSEIYQIINKVVILCSLHITSCFIWEVWKNGINEIGKLEILKSRNYKP